jgi:outer membrane biosynthesis protein TonB
MVAKSPWGVWGVAAAVSVVVNLAMTAWAGAAWDPGAGRPGTAVTQRDVSFLMGYLRREVREGTAVPARPEPPRQEPAPVAATRNASSPVPPVVAPPRADGGRTGVEAPVPARSAEPPKPPPAPVPDPPSEDVTLIALDAGAAQSVAAAREIPETGPRATLNTRFWLQRAVQRIMRNLRDLLDREETARGLHGSVVIVVVFRRDGSLTEMQYVSHSNHPVLDVIAEQAIRRSAPFQSFYAGMDMEYLPWKFHVRF